MQRRLSPEPSICCKLDVRTGIYRLDTSPKESLRYSGLAQAEHMERLVRGDGANGVDDLEDVLEITDTRYETANSDAVEGEVRVLGRACPIALHVPALDAGVQKHIFTSSILKSPASVRNGELAAKLRFGAVHGWRNWEVQ